MKEKLKNKIIQIVNSTKDENLLEQVYNILDSRSHFTENQLFENLNDHKKNETKLSLAESDDKLNLEDHESVMKEIRAKFGWN